MSRADLQGLWWDDPNDDYTSRRGERREFVVRNVAPPITNWLPSKDLPNLSNVKLLGLDTETKDLDLLDKGPGFIRGAAHIVGVSVAVEDAAWYFPIRHEYAPQVAMNMNPEKVFKWLQAVLNSTKAIVGANLSYDFEALRAEGVLIPNGIRGYDVLYAEPLIDENRYQYSLETLSQQYLKEGKESPLLYKWCADSFGGAADAKQRANIWRSPPTLVGPYAESDAILPVKILAEQMKKLEEEELVELFHMECDLIPLLLDMRFTGVRIDEERAIQASKWLREQAKIAQDKIPGIDVWSGLSLERAFKREGHEILYTEAGNASFTRGWLEAQEHPLAKAILDVRLYEKCANPFIESYLLGNLHKGRVHCQFHPLRSDNYGTVSGRFSSSNPNLQNIPSRHPVLGPYLRSLYIPENDCDWTRGDHSQIEYRLLVHDAVGKGADDLRKRFKEDPTTDFHQLTIDMTKEITGITLARTPAKNLNFGLVYGMGKDKTTRSLGVSPEIGARLYDAYFKAMPSVKETNQLAQRIANRKGYIKTRLKRRRRFPKMKESKFGKGEERVGVHAALNARLQGGAADVLKKGMVNCHKAGLFEPDACGYLHLTVHDELDISTPRTARAAQATAEMKHIMETCVKLKVPLIFQLTKGSNWGEAK